MALPVPITAAVGQRFTAAEWNLDVRDATDFIIGNGDLPMCQVYQSGSLTCTTATDKLMTFDTEVYDTASMHSTSSNTSRVNLPLTGLYAVKAYVRFASDSTGYRAANVRKNAAGSSGGGSSVKTDNVAAVDGIGTTVFSVFERRFTAGDYLELFAYQNSGGDLAASGGGIDFVGMTVRWLAT